ncbi:MAG: 2-oxopent-4-enoate hydratase [Sinimarinibacterium flocculans]|uniref:2-oxopent-4-enoate hydratase n=1 Tax=Sinimarinibacterium flocculans TaxID=985250 RepID=UPI003C42A3C3
MNSDLIRDLGDRLHQALATRTPLAPLTETHPELTVDDAYGIQLRMIEHRLKAGETVVGKKIGVTSKAVQQMLGVFQPDFGHLLSGMVYNEGEPVLVSSLIAPRAEAEIAFVLHSDLVGPGVTAEDVLCATEFVMPCFEIVDSRIQDWKIKIQDTVADNASCGVFILGGQARRPHDIDLELAGMVVEKNGELISTSAGASVQGSPANAVAWLANTLGRYGIPLKAGEVILSGSQSPLIPVAAGDSLVCSVGGLGSCSVRFK